MLSAEEQFRRDTAVSVLCAMLSNSDIVGNDSDLSKLNPQIISDIAINHAEVLISRLKRCRHRNLEKVTIENIDGSKTCPDCGSGVK